MGEIIRLTCLPRVFLACAGLIAFLSVADQLWLRVRFSQVIPEDPFDWTVEEKKLLPPDFPSAAIYSETVSEEALFGVVRGPKAISTPAISLEEALKDWRLKGIAVIGQPEAILENAATRQILFLKSGEKLDGFLVDSVGSEGVVVMRGGERKELRIEN